MARGEPVGMPEPDDLAALIAPRSARTSKASSRRGPQNFEEYLGPDAVGSMNELMARRATPMAGMPVAATGAEFYDAITIYENEAGDYYNPEHDAPDGFRSVSFVDAEDFVPPKSAAPLSVVPTSTTNAARPRTVAAGYERKRAVLTVVFRDGTYYNYYEVMPSTWQAFKAVKSKGKYIREYLDFGPRGIADVSSLSGQAREILSRMARVQQITGQDHKGTYRQVDQIKRLAAQRARRARRGK